MPESKNQNVLAMVERLAARLMDVREVVLDSPVELTGFDKRLDKVDDQLYLTLVAMEKAIEQQNNQESDVLNAASEPTDTSQVTESADNQSKTSYSIPLKEADQPIKTMKEVGLEEKKQIFTPEMKENLTEAGRSLMAVAKDGKEVVSELTSTMTEFKDLFDFKGKFKR